MVCELIYDKASEAFRAAISSGPEAAIAAARTCLASMKGMQRDHDSISYISETHLRKNHPELFQNGKFILEPGD